MEDLIDIEGLDYIGAWPLAWGWWLIIAFMILLACGTAVYLLLRYRYRRSWQYKAHVRLQNLQNAIDTTASKIILQNLSIELRKIAMLTTKREECAGLLGHRWLQWLQDHDPRGFKWLENGKLLLEAQYMPTSISNDKEQILALLIAAKGWVQKC